MIHQISPVKTKTQPLPQFNKGLTQVRRIQAKLNGRIIDAVPLEDGVFWSPITSGPYLVPVTRYVE